MATAAGEALDRRAAAAPVADFHPGDEWMPHRELAALQAYPMALSDCPGRVLVDSVARGRAELSCDGCTFVVTATLEEMARSLQTRDEKWWQR